MQKKLSVRSLSLVCALACVGGSALAQTYPNKPVRVVVTTVPGPLDAFARAVLAQMQTNLNQPFVVDNKPGAGGNVGADVVAKAAADGYTLLFALDTTFTVNPSLYEKMPFDPDRDFSVIGVPVTYSQVLVSGPSMKATSLPQFVQMAKAKQLSYASGGNGSPSHLTMAAFLSAAGLNMTHIPYKGTGASVVDVLGGQVDALFAVGSGVLPHAKAGKLQALASSGTQRSAATAELPTVAEQGYPNFNATFAYVLAAPAGTPPEIVNLLAKEMNLALKSPKVMELNRVADYTETQLSQQASAEWLRHARGHWHGVITTAKIKGD